MKNLKKTMMCLSLLVAMTSNVWALSGQAVTVSLIEQLVAALASALGDDDCEEKQCQTCKPSLPTCRPMP